MLAKVGSAQAGSALRDRRASPTPRPAPRRQCASGMDQVLAGQRFVALFGDLDTPALPVLSEAVAAIAAVGPHTRLALTPRTRKRVWSYDPGVLPPVIELSDRVAAADSAAVLQYIRSRPEHRHPLEILVSPRHIAFDVDHGLGDGRFALELLSALFAYSRGGSTPWVADNDTVLALPRALLGTFAAHPTRARQAWRYLPTLRSHHTDATAADSLPWSPSLASTVVHVTADAESAVNDWRRDNADKSGSAAVWLSIVSEALRAAQLRLEDTVMVAFDCRRYLPQRYTANNNFIIGLEIPWAGGDGLSVTSTRLRKVTAAAVPLAAMAAVSTVGLMRARREPVTQSVVRPGAPVQVMYTDMGHIRMLDGMPWRTGGEPPSLTGLLDSAGPSAITILNSRIGATRNISISFHDNVVDRSIINTVADYLRDPLRLLTSV